LHLRCSLCFLESAAAQGMWALPTPGRGMIPLHPAHFLTARARPEGRAFLQNYNRLYWASKASFDGFSCADEYLSIFG